MTPMSYAANNSASQGGPSFDAQSPPCVFTLPVLALPYDGQGLTGFLLAEVQSVEFIWSHSRMCRPQRIDLLDPGKPLFVTWAARPGSHLSFAFECHHERFDSIGSCLLFWSHVNSPLLVDVNRRTTIISLHRFINTLITTPESLFAPDKWHN